jgi:CO/xanthine dehydrogenase FAD-binding subunit
VTPHDDALASAWYRSRTLPVLVRRALTDLT